MSNSTTSSTDASPATTTGEPDPELIAHARARIDECDRTIIEALNERTRLAQATQAYKVLTGLPQVDLKREQEIYAHYASLGWTGSAVAYAILNHSKGS